MSAGNRPLRDRLKSEYAYLVNELSVSFYVDALFEAEVICDEEREQLRLVQTREEQAGLLLEVLVQKSEFAIAKFMEILRKTTHQPHIYEKLFAQPAMAEQQDRPPQGVDCSDLATALHATASSQEEGKVDDEWEELVIPRFAAVEAALRPSLLLDDLLARALITASEYSRLQQGSWTETERSRELLRNILPWKGKGAFAQFCQIVLRVEGQQHIVTEVLSVDVAAATLKGVEVGKTVSDMASSPAGKAETRGLAEQSQGFTTEDVSSCKIFQPGDLKYEDDDIVGSGGFTDVFRAVIEDDGQDVVVALKRPIVGRSHFTNEQMNELREEASILLAIPPHDHIIKMIGICDDRRHFALVLEFVDGGDLHSLLLSTYNLDPYFDNWRNRLISVCQIADGMNHLHSLNPPVIHCDLKPQNILVQKTSPNYVCKITDFGISKISATSSPTSPRRNRRSLDATGTSAYIAPERFNSQQLDMRLLAKSDVYSYGVMLWVFRERKQPFGDELDVVIRANRFDGVHFMLPRSWCPAGYDTLTYHCCNSEPIERPVFAEILTSIGKIMQNLGMEYKDGGDVMQAREVLRDRLQIRDLADGLIDQLGPEGRKHYFEALSKGTLQVARANLDMVGDGEAGKSSLGDSLMDEPFKPDKESTEGAHMIYMVRMATGYRDKWTNEERGLSLKRLLARGSVQASQMLKEEEDRATLKGSSQAYQKLNSQAESLETKAIPLQTKSTADVNDLHKRDTMPVTVKHDQPVLVVGEELFHSSSKPADGSKDALVLDQEVVVSRQKAFHKAKELTKEQAAAIRAMEKDPNALEKEKDLVFVTVCDRGGQEHYLPLHTVLMANCSDFIPKAYLVVFDLSKPLRQRARSTFRTKQGADKIQYIRFRVMTNGQVIGSWASIIDLAHPDSEIHGKPYLGQDKVRRGPPMFMVGTHKDELDEGESGEAFVKQQEEDLRKILSKHNYIQRVVTANDATGELIFQVDNKRSGTGNPDEMVGSLKEVVVGMAKTYRDKMKPTPMPWVVLEIGLFNVSLTSSDGICDSDSKIMNIEDVFTLAQQYCDIPNKDQCKTALRYLSSFGGIFYFFAEVGLKKQIFTDPQWLFDVMSTYVTVLGENKVSHLYDTEVKQLKEEGHMSRELAEHLLEKRKQLHVKPKHYNTIFRLLQLVDVFCPADSYSPSGELAIGDINKFYVPCMLEVDYDGETAWERSGSHHGVGQSCSHELQPPSLIFKPTNVEFFPEPLFFRLFARTVYQYPNDPGLKRNRVRVHLPCLDLELLYHFTNSYVIATVYHPHDNEAQRSFEDVNRQCVYVRNFLCWQLTDAKRHGMDGFQYKVFFQDEKKAGQKEVEDRSLCPLPSGNQLYETNTNPETGKQEKKMITNPNTNERIKESSYESLKIWYCSEETSYGGKEDSAAVRSYFSIVAEGVKDRWKDLARAMKPRPFYRNEFIKFEDDRDKSEYGKALRMLKAWKKEHEDDATTLCLKQALTNAGFPIVADKLDTQSTTSKGTVSRDRVIDAIVDHGEDIWYDFGLKLQFTNAKINTLTSVPNNASKLRRIIQAAVNRDGKKKAVNDLLDICKRLGILGAVKNELGVNASQEIRFKDDNDYEPQQLGQVVKDFVYRPVIFLSIFVAFVAILVTLWQ